VQLPKQAVAPAVLSYFPPGQAVQNAAPAPLNEPAAHAAHVDALLAPTAGLYVPAAQALQLAADARGVEAPYRPAAQGVHAVAAGEAQ
jgi:hypothetical protein